MPSLKLASKVTQLKSYVARLKRSVQLRDEKIARLGAERRRRLERLEEAQRQVAMIDASPAGSLNARCKLAALDELRKVRTGR